MNYKFLLLFICTFSMTSQLSLAQVIQENVIAGELPDPSIIEVEGVYYVTGSSNDWGPVYPIYKSEDLKNWTLINYVFSKKPDWTISSFWAPELFFHNGTFYCYYTARKTDGTSLIGVATSADITQKFTDHGELLAWGNEAIDAFVVKEEGKLYITWKAYGLDRDKPIQILGSALSEDGLSLEGEHFNVLTADENSWENGGIEGQCIIKNGDYLYMLYSGNSCCGEDCNYQVGVARAKTIKGPWTKYAQNPLLAGNKTWKCPGHGTALKTNDKWFYLYHAYPAAGFPYLGRTPVLSELQWGNQTEWPYFKKDSAIDSQKILKTEIQDDFNTAQLASWWRYDIPNHNFETKLENGKLIVTTKKNEENVLGAFIGVNPESAEFTMTTKISNNNNTLKGLALYVTKKNSLGAGVRDNKLIVWKVVEGKFQILQTINLEKSKAIYLTAHITDAHTVAFKYRYKDTEWISVVNEANKPLKITGENLKWWSWGIKAGLFVKNEKHKSRAAFDEFSLTYDN